VAIHHLREYIRPKDLGEALATLHRLGTAARPIGGGVDLVRHTPPGVSTLVDMTALPLAYVREEENGLHIGATTTLGEIERNTSLAEYADGVLPEMLGHVGSMQLRNLATLGGALVGAHPWSDVVTVLLALDATAAIHDGSDHAIRVADRAAMREFLSGGVLTEVLLPTRGAEAHAAFAKFSLSAFDVAMLNVCACLRWSETGCQDARIVVGGTPWLATALPRAGETLQGADLGADSIAAAATTAATEAQVGDDRRATAEYRRVLVEVGVRRALEAILGRCKGGGT